MSGERVEEIEWLRDYLKTCGNGVTGMTAELKYGEVKTILAAYDALRGEQQAIRDFMLSWILRAYESRKREGWEEGMSDQELNSALLDILFNYGADPGLSQHSTEVKRLRQVRPVRHHQDWLAREPKEQG